jgi:excisionase family DNA binding protein
MQKTTFTLAEAAQILRCHPATVRKAVLDGSLQAAKLGRGYRISRADLQKFWTASGGGELFDKPQERAETAEPPVSAKEESAKPGKKGRKGAWQRQLELPIK